MKKQILLNSLFWTVLPFTVLMAEEEVLDHITVPFSDPGKPGFVEIDLLKGSVTVKGYEGSEADITTRSTVKKPSEPEPKREGTNGMFRIPVTSSELEVEEENNRMEINLEAMKEKVDIEIKVPINTSLYIQTVHDGNIYIENVNGEIEAESVHGSIIMKNVSGSAAASTTHGNITVAMNRANPDKPMSFNTFHGDVDITFPSTLKATVKIKTTEGEVYSDFNIMKTDNPNLINREKSDRKEGKYKVVIEHGFYGTINGGGPEFSFTTFNGDILIHKGK